MELRKITKAEFHVKNTKPVVKKDVIRVIDGKKAIRIHLDYPLVDKEIIAGTYTFFVLVPECYTEIPWNQVFRAAHKNKSIRNAMAGIKTEMLNFESFNLRNGSVLFAFKS